MIDLEQECWIAIISDVLLPERRDAVVAALRADRHRDGCERDVGDPWALLDPDALRARELSMAARLLRAEQAAIVACQRYERTRRASYLRDAVVELETAVRVEREPLGARVPKAACREEGDRLERALRNVLPPSAFRFLATQARGVIAPLVCEATRQSWAPDVESDQWLSRATWTVGLDEDRAAGVWFIDWFQRRYEDGMEQEGLDEEAIGARQKNASDTLRQRRTERDEATLRPAAAGAPERAAVMAPAVEQDSITRDEERAAEVPIPSARMPRDYRVWPSHAEANARLEEEARRSAAVENEEFTRARQLLASREADRPRAEIEGETRLKSFEAKRARKASPARIQSGGALARLENP